MKQPNTFLSFSDLSVRFDDVTLFSKISGSVLSESRIGLIGPNGAGKSTLLSVLAGKHQQTSGSISRHGSVALVEQYTQPTTPVERDTDASIQEYIQRSRNDEWWNTLVVLETLFSEPCDTEQPISTLSGGEWTKLHIALAFASAPDLLILDEPTNHLDGESIDRLREYLRRSEIPFIITSHQPSFLNAVCTEIWDLRGGTLQRWQGSYDTYIEHLEYVRDSHLRQQSVLRQHIEHTEKIIRAKQERHAAASGKMSRLARSGDRSTGRAARDSQKKNSAAHVGNYVKRFEQRIRLLETARAELSEFKPKPIHIDLPQNNKKGLLIEIEDGTLLLPNGTTLLEKIAFRLEHKERIAITGKNGSGKSLFVRELRYEQSLYMRGNIRYGAPYQTMIVDQFYKFLVPNKTLYENMREYCQYLTDEQIRLQLARVRFRGEEATRRRINTLSGGERARVAIAIATASNTDLLVLDEPTNNLDYDTVEILSEAIRQYNGTLIIVSHDNDFLTTSRIQKRYEIQADKTLM